MGLINVPDRRIRKPIGMPQIDWEDPLNRGLIGHWGIFPYEFGGKVVHDLSGNGTSLTLTNGPVWGVGPNDSRIIFDGADDYLLGSKQPPTCPTQITIMWSGYVEPHGTGDAFGRITDWFDAPSIYRTAPGDSDKIGWYGDIAGVPVDTSVSNSVFTGAQHICAVTFDGTDIKAYIDAVLDGTVNSPGVLSAPSNTFCIGGRSTGTDRCLSESLNWVIMWNRALADAEIDSLTWRPF